MVASKEIKQIELVIDRNDIMVKQYVAGIWEGPQAFSGFSYQAGFDVKNAQCTGQNNEEFPCQNDKRRHQIIVKFPEPFNPQSKYSYILKMLLNPETHLLSLGELKTIDWPKENLTDIIFLRNAGEIFFSSALAEVKYDPYNYARIISPGKFAKSLTSHARNSSAIRIEWGIAPRFRLKFRYKIHNSSTDLINNFHLQSYIPPTTKFQKAYFHVPSNVALEKDEDLNWIMNAKYPSISGGETKYLNFYVDLRPIGNLGVLLPYFGEWIDYRALTEPGSIGHGLIQESKYWPTHHPSIRTLTHLLQKNYSNASDYIKYGFEFVNQKIKYKINNRREDALETFKSRKGDCSEMSDLFVCILRSAGIPAKIVHGWTINIKTHALNPHAWCEFFSPKANGWRQCDPTWGFLTGVSCQHICRQREGLQPDQNTYSWRYNGKGNVEVKEQVRLIIK